MSKNYKEAMDKIKLSEDMKAKILENINNPPELKKPVRKNTYHITRGLCYAACLLICFTAVSSGVHFKSSTSDNVPPAVSTPPQHSAAPVQSQAPQNNLPVNSEPPAEQSGIYEKPYKPEKTSPSAGQQIAKSSQKPQTNDNNTSDSSFFHGSAAGSQNDKPSSPDNNTDLVLSSGFNSSEASLPPEDEQLEQSFGGSPFSSDIETVSDIRNNLDYDFKTPQFMPENYENDSTSLLFDSLIQISYTNGDERILYRTKKNPENDDISGDYSTYEQEATESVNGVSATLKSNDNLCHTALWHDGDFAYSLYSSGGLECEEMLKIIENVDFSKSE